MLPEITVVTICFNNLEELKITCNSVDVQTHLPNEHLIINGSTTTDIEKWAAANSNSYRRFIHEKDNGISDAFNKGITNARFDIIHLLHAGDCYADKNIIEFAKKQFVLQPNIKWLHGKYIQLRAGKQTISGTPFNKDLIWKGMRQIGHVTMFVKKDLYTKYGMFDNQYKIAMDYDFIMRIQNENFAYIDTPMVVFEPGGISSTQQQKGKKEVKHIYEKYLGKSIKFSLWQWRQFFLEKFTNSFLGKWWYSPKTK
jgi:glycosyltransferase involved in cell wall biosynthesis